MLRTQTLAIFLFFPVYLIGIVNHHLSAQVVQPKEAEGHGAAVDFQRDIQPILAQKCLHCHGGDASARQAGLRLDDGTAALKGGDSGAVIDPGRPEASRLLERVSSADPAVMMPPPSELKPVTAEERRLLREWIAAGATFTSHWAFVPPRKVPLDEKNRGNPIDMLVERQLARVGLQPAVAAAPEVLCRRLYLDLIGLPPSPQEVERFRQDGVEATVRLLLASPRFGEKWARHWLDVARYSDTNGYEKDLQRDQWIWRDWVIQSLNTDMPYDQFIIEQLAGDMLPEATPSQVIATGFLRNSMLNEEGAIVPEQFRMVEMFDRIDCLGKAVLGLSVQCAQCHAHKFDPVSHDEYFGMFAFLNNSYEAQSWVYNAEQMQTRREINGEIERQLAAAKLAAGDWQSAMKRWQSDALAQQSEWQAVHFSELGSNSGLNHPVQLSDHSVLMLGHTSTDVFFIAKGDWQGATGLRIEALPHGDLPFRGPGRSKLGTWGIRELDVFLRTPESKEWKKIKLTEASADYSSPEAADAEGKKRTGPVKYLIDGSEDTSWLADRGEGERHQASAAAMQFESPLDVPAGSELKVAMRMGDMLGCCRISITRSAAPKILALSHGAMLALEQAEADRSADETRQVEIAWIRSDAALKNYADALQAQLAKTPTGYTSVLHLLERSGRAQRETHHLDRGAWDQPRAVVRPHTPAALHPLEVAGEPNRLDFARWLVDRRSPLAARVAVNRIWQAIFGEGLVETPEDLGTRSAVPEQLELLDWLAVDFMETGWSQKRLIEQIVSSRTYQQASLITPLAMEKDPRNRWLSRGPRFRADAEIVRDIALSVSGLINHKVGGPSVIVPVPQNVLDYNYVYPGYWKPATGPERYRRTLYGFRKRSMPDPVMANFDGPNGDLACSRRMRSNTPLAALTALNEIIFVEAAQGLGLRIVRECDGDDRMRAQYGFAVCTGRLPSKSEVDEIVGLVQSRRIKLAEGWLNPREIATGDAARLPELPPGVNPQDVAAWTLAARVLLNLDETLTKN